MEQFTHPQHEFQLLKELDQDVWVAFRKNDPHGQRFLARRIDHFDELFQTIRDGRYLNDEDREALAYNDLLYDFGQARLVSQLFNHENIVSIVGAICNKAVTIGRDTEPATEDVYLVWDYCDASNLTAVFRDNPHPGNTTHYLPESLCWHVLRSLIRAVAYLHEGERPCINEKWGPSFESVRYHGEDYDWLPVLHRAIEPDNIFFQHPRGTETYGLCKLGNFSNAAVAVRHDRLTLAPAEGWRPFAEIFASWKADPEQLQAGDWPYTLGDELFAIGAVVFRMMTGHTPTHNCKTCGCSHIVKCGAQRCLETAADIADCDCIIGGCQHIPAEACPHESTDWSACPHLFCNESVINVDEWLIRAEYSKMLRREVEYLLSYDPKKRMRKWLDAESVERGYKEWKKETWEGRRFRDLEDEMAELWEIRQKDEEEAKQRRKEALGSGMLPGDVKVEEVEIKKEKGSVK